MAWSEKLKLSKQLLRTLSSEGLNQPTALQSKTLSRIIGGQDVVVAGHEGSGKTTTYVLAVLSRLGHQLEGVPMVLVLVPAAEQVITTIDHFNRFNKNRGLRIVGLHAEASIESQMDALADGADIVVATPDRARAVYLKLGLNLNKINLLIIDDADKIVKQGLQLPVTELANSITKCQHLVFTEVIHDRLNKLIEPFMKQPAIIEVNEISAPVLETYPQLLYHVPDFGTKLNLLNLFMQDEEVFTKTVIFVNTRQTAEKLYKTLQNRLNTTVAILKPWFYEHSGFNSITDFKDSDVRALIVVNQEEATPGDLHPIPFIIHFELPEHNAVLVERITGHDIAPYDETLAITFATDLELSAVKKIELTIGQQIPLADLPDELVIKPVKEKSAAKTKKTEEDPTQGGAFHQKKAANSKTYNYSSGQKAKMNKKKKH